MDNLVLFCGNHELNEMHALFSELLHTWDDLVDKDKEVTELEINRAFLICLVDLPANLIYKKISDDIRPLWLSVVSAYCVANTYEAKKKENLLDISHGLRYAAGHIMAYATIREFGLEKANDIMGDVWQHIFENLDEYKTEHLCQKD